MGRGVLLFSLNALFSFMVQNFFCYLVVFFLKNFNFPVIMKAVICWILSVHAQYFCQSSVCRYQGHVSQVVYEPIIQISFIYFAIFFHDDDLIMSQFNIYYNTSDVVVWVKLWHDPICIISVGPTFFFFFFFFFWELGDEFMISWCCGFQVISLLIQGMRCTYQ